MAAPTVTEIQSIGKIAQYMASNDISKSGLIGPITNPLIAQQIYLVRKPLEYRYGMEDIAGGATPSESLVNTSNYFYSLLGVYGIRARAAISSGGVIPSPTPATIMYGYPRSSRYTATTDGETTFELKDANGDSLPVGTKIFDVEKGLWAIVETSNYTYSYPAFTLLNGESMTEGEVLSFSYVYPV